MANRPLFVKSVVALLGAAVVCHALAASSAQAGGWHHGQKYRAVNAYLVQGSTGVAAAPAASAAPAAYYTYSAAPAAAAAGGCSRACRLLHYQRRPGGCSGLAGCLGARRRDRVHDQPARGLPSGIGGTVAPGTRCPLRAGLRPGGTVQPPRRTLSTFPSRRPRRPRPLFLPRSRP